VLPAPSAAGNAAENTLLASTAAELERLKLRPREVALDGAFGPIMSRDQLAQVAPERVFVAGRHEPGSRRTRKRLARYHTGTEGRISHLTRGSS
jgi:transposase, IS5 family